MQQQSKQNVYLHLGVISHDSFYSKFYRTSGMDPRGNWPACIFLMHTYHTRVGCSSLYNFMLDTKFLGGVEIMVLLDKCIVIYQRDFSAIENITFFIQHNNQCKFSFLNRSERPYCFHSIPLIHSSYPKKKSVLSTQHR